MTTHFLADANLRTLLGQLLAAGTKVIAPARGKTHERRLEYRPIDSVEQAALGQGLPRRPLKSHFFPPTEPLLKWRQSKEKVELEEVATTFAPFVILGAYPCDVAALNILDRVMNWDYRDELWFARREAATIISLACPGEDDACFCSALGLAPGAKRAADILLTPVNEGYVAEVLSPKGQALLASQGSLFSALTTNAETQASQFRDQAHGRIQKNVRIDDPAQVQGWLKAHFDHPLWIERALPCHGCGACASLCPTCHCFDIIDEPVGMNGGTRRRNWDTCQSAKFTVHGSGHNPRAHQGARLRQRLMHKFSIYPERFGEVLCTGCGRCSRGCPGGVPLSETLNRLAELAGDAASAPRGGVR
jgi:ferredoxin